MEEFGYSLSNIANLPGFLCASCYHVFYGWDAEKIQRKRNFFFSLDRLSLMSM